MATENVRLARRWFEEVWNQRRSDTIDELLAEESLSHSESGLLRGSREFKERAHAVFLAAFPDLRMTVEGTVAARDQVVVRWAATATHLGDRLGFPASGKKVSFRGMTWVRYRDGKMIEGSDCWNQAGLIQSLREPESSQDDLAKFQGTWATVTFEKQGAKTPKEHLGEVRLVIERDRYRYEEPGGGFEGRYRLDPTKRPKEIDSIPTSGSTGAGWRRGSTRSTGTRTGSASPRRAARPGRPRWWKARARGAGSMC